MSKEWLEEIKRMWHEDGDINDKAFYWLIEQAERVQELESKLNKQIEIGYKFEGEVYDLAKQNKRYRKAINNINKKAMMFGTSKEVYDAIQDALKV